MLDVINVVALHRPVSTGMDNCGLVNHLGMYCKCNQPSGQLNSTSRLSLNRCSEYQRQLGSKHVHRDMH